MQDLHREILKESKQDIQVNRIILDMQMKWPGDVSKHDTRYINIIELNLNRNGKLLHINTKKN